MKSITNFKAVITILITLTTFASAYAGESSRIVNWKFNNGSHPKAMQNDFDDSDWQDVKVPHDWAIEEHFIKDGDGSTGKLPWKGQGWYRTKITKEQMPDDKIVYLLFDGVMAFPKVYVNGQLAGQWDYGYNSFYVDITPFLAPDGDNVIAVHADTRDHDSRWYPGAGIYRKVQLITADKIHAAIWGTYITTPVIKPNYADVRISTTVNNHDDKDTEITVENSIISPAGVQIATEKISDTIKAGKSKDLEVTIPLKDPQRWDIDNPVLYSVKTVIKTAGKIHDTITTNFGVRSIRFTADHGFYLNDRRVQLKGVNLHHDHGPLGAAFNTRAMERQLQIMKSMGVNAIRNSHNVAAPELAGLCDRMGLLLFNEIFDKYDQKADILPDTDFDEFAHRNIRNFIIRDRNHPSVFLWSVGNEIGDVQWNINNGFQRLNTMLTYVRKYDPTRPTTLVCDNQESARLRHFDYYDVHSWNYGRRYELARRIEPNKAVIISESASTVSTRGFYELPLPAKKTDFTNSLQVSSYDLNAPWWAEVADDDFMWQQEEEYIAGEFVWTGFDYLGEPTPYFNDYVKELGMTDEDASRSSYFGIVDLVGLPKDRYYLYKSYWKPQETTIHILPHWNWTGKEGSKIPVFVYTNGDEAELFLNGKSQGKRSKNPKSQKSIERFRLMWHDVVYQPGELKVVAYKEGQKIGEQVVKTAGDPHQIRLTADRRTIKADGMDLSYITIEALDKDGSLCPLADNNIVIEIDGSAVIAGVGNGNPQSFTPFKSNKVQLFYGQAMLILEASGQKGTATVKVSSDGLKGAEISILCE